MKPRKAPLIEYTENDTRDIVFHTKDIEVETTGIINNRGYLYVGLNFEGRKVTVLILREKENEAKNRTE
jgi:hypothetical protein